MTKVEHEDVDHLTLICSLKEAGRCITLASSVHIPTIINLEKKNGACILYVILSCDKETIWCIAKLSHPVGTITTIGEIVGCIG